MVLKTGRTQQNAHHGCASRTDRHTHTPTHTHVRQQHMPPPPTHLRVRVPGAEVHDAALVHDRDLVALRQELDLALVVVVGVGVVVVGRCVMVVIVVAVQLEDEGVRAQAVSSRHPSPPQKISHPETILTWCVTRTVALSRKMPRTQCSKMWCAVWWSTADSALSSSTRSPP